MLRDQQGEDDCRTLQESALAKNSLFLQIFLVDQPFWLDTDHFWVFDFSFLSFLFSIFCILFAGVFLELELGLFVLCTCTFTDAAGGILVWFGRF